MNVTKAAPAARAAFARRAVLGQGKIADGRGGRTGVLRVLVTNIKGGCGKTTLLRVIAGLEAADSGTVLFDGDDFLDTYEGSATEGQSLTTLDPAITVRNLATDFSTIEFGQNGPDTSTTVTDNMWEGGAFAISAEDWIGPYVSGEAD